MHDARKVLMIEDEQDIARIVRDYLNKNRYETAIAGTAEEGLQMMELLQPDYIILDIMLPDRDGIEVCREIRRRNNIPILMLSARGSDTDKVLCLGFGADDYMTKPFSLSELLARINAHFRRYDRLIAERAEGHVLRFGDLTIDKKAYRVTRNGLEIPLSAKEFEVLHVLASHKNQVFSKAQILDAVWGYASYGDENTVTVYIRRLREKIETDPSHPQLLKTVWGVGYKFNVD
ncbi:response regulator transcription factor [Paenibacillus sp. JJ-223]|uniref:response regulator transcription factor n=1 Tax=Paenibacillus sp. JJ-223 TaxID=2905647 RepID=UPI001F2541C6|nr:response regulator transcription factor [Paenibacillus sp. JJ-223]CAH1220618.1 Transcriptional regulatory protein WalR [Paenibacillus sp. JJ-223]